MAQLPDLRHGVKPNHHQWPGRPPVEGRLPIVTPWEDCAARSGWTETENRPIAFDSPCVIPVVQNSASRVAAEQRHPFDVRRALPAGSTAGGMSSGADLA